MRVRPLPTCSTCNCARPPRCHKPTEQNGPLHPCCATIGPEVQGPHRHRPPRRVLPGRHPRGVGVEGPHCQAVDALGQGRVDGPEGAHGRGAACVILAERAPPDDRLRGQDRQGRRGAWLGWRMSVSVVHASTYFDDVWVWKTSLCLSPKFIPIYRCVKLHR